MRHYITTKFVTHCGALAPSKDDRAMTWHEVSCLRCLGRPEEADIEDAFAPALRLITQVLDSSGRDYYEIAKQKNQVIFARNELMSIIAKQVPENVKAAREAARVATVSE